MASVQTRLGDHAARLRRNNNGQQQRQRGTSPASSRQSETFPADEHHTAYLQAYYCDNG